MNSLLHLLSSGVIILLLTGFYFLVLQHLKSYHANRIVLITIPIVAFLIPFLSTSFTPNGGLISSVLSTVEISGNTINSTQGSLGFSLINGFFFIYFLGIAVGVIRLFKDVRNIQKLINNSNLVVIKGETLFVNPLATDAFTFIDKIVVPNKDVNEFIVQHEQIHVKHKHYIDLFMAELVSVILWFIPGIRTYKKGVVMNHEFSADSYSGSPQQVDAYCEQLLSNTFGVSSFASCHTFNNQSITKSRIIMMYKKSTSPLRTIAGYLLIIPFVVGAIFIASGKNNQIQITDNTAVYISNFEDVVKPEYPGGKAELFKFMGANVKYPEAAKSANVEGTVFVSFIVTSKGKIEKVKVSKGVSDEIDAEAIRVVKSMPNWKPGTKDGKKVDMEMTLPIKFVLD